MKDGQPSDTRPPTADWEEITKLWRVQDNLQLAALRELLKDSKKMRGALENALAEAGATREDLKDLLLKFDPKN
jgi:hypothetical protein